MRCAGGSRRSSRSTSTTQGALRCDAMRYAALRSCGVGRGGTHVDVWRGQDVANGMRRAGLRQIGGEAGRCDAAPGERRGDPRLTAGHSLCSKRSALQCCRCAGRVAEVLVCLGLTRSRHPVCSLVLPLPTHCPPQRGGWRPARRCEADGPAGAVRCGAARHGGDGHAPGRSGNGSTPPPQHAGCRGPCPARGCGPGGPAWIHHTRGHDHCHWWPRQPACLPERPPRECVEHRRRRPAPVRPRRPPPSSQPPGLPAAHQFGGGWCKQPTGPPCRPPPIRMPPQALALCNTRVPDGAVTALRSKRPTLLVKHTGAGMERSHSV